MIEEGAEDGIQVAQAWAREQLGMKMKNPSTKLGAGNPDVVVLRYGLFSVEDARRVSELAASAPFAGEHKVVIISANRAYHEAQNALLKLFEEPPRGTYLFLVLPTLGSLLPTLRSRVQEISLSSSGRTNIGISETAREFIKASKEKRTAMIKKLASGKDEEEKRELREEAMAIVNGIEAIAYIKATPWERASKTSPSEIASLLSDIATLRGYLHDRSAPVKMIMEHLSLVIPEDLRGKV